VLGRVLHLFDGIQLHRFLEPSIWTVAAEHATPHAVPMGLELQLMATSIIVAFIGFLIAYWLYYRRPDLPDRIAAASEPIYTLVYHKYFVDEIYNALIVRPLLAFATALAWFDRVIVDGIVNGIAWLTRQTAALSGLADAFGVDGVVNGVADGVAQLGATLRRAHTGVAQAYVMGALALALLFILVYVMVF